MRKVSRNCPQGHALFSQLHDERFVIRHRVLDAESAARAHSGHHVSGHKLLCRLDRRPRVEDDRQEMLTHLPLERKQFLGWMPAQMRSPK